MNSEGLGLNCVEAMYDLCSLGPRAALAERTWSLPQWDLYVKISATRTQYAVWTIFVTFQPDADLGYWPIKAQLFLENNFVGRISMAHQNNPWGSTKDNNATAFNVSSAVSSSLVSASTEGVQHENPASVEPAQPWNVTTVPDDSIEVGVGSPLTIELRYNGVSMRNRMFFRNTLAAMSYLAQYNPTLPIMALAGEIDLSMESEVDSQGKPLLRIRHVYKVARQMANWMVNNHRYGEADIILSKDGARIATGRLRAGETPSNAAIEVTNSTFINQATS